MNDSRTFQVNLRGIIDLLSDHLYSGPQVYIRELMQNAVDAISARQRHDPTHNGNVCIEVVDRSGDSPATLVVTDNGIGLTESEVHEFLATIGQSSKRDPLSRDDFIGQFGIGLLSGFMVCDEIVLITRSAQLNSSTVQWTGRSDGTYSVRVLDHDFEPGSQVYLRAKPDCSQFFEPDFVNATARYYGEFLPHPIAVATAEGQETINTHPPWQIAAETRDAERDLLVDYGQRYFDQPFLDAIQVKCTSGGITGVAFVLSHAANAGSKQVHRVYVKNMLLSERVDNLLPDWAFFVHCVLNVTDLPPTASRESFHDDELLAAARDALGASLREWLVRMAQFDRQRLEQIIALHYLPMKALAVDDDEFYRMFIDWLPFDTSLGRMTLVDLAKHDSTVRYVASLDQFRQVSSVAASQGLAVVNGGFVHDVELIEKLPWNFPDRRVEKTDASELSQSFDELTLDERELAFDLLRVAELSLQPFRCEAEIRRFEPAEVPALFVAGEGAVFLRSIEKTQEVADELWSGLLSDLESDSTRTTWAQLCFNYANPLIQRLVTVRNRDVVRHSVETLYIQSLLLGHYPLKATELGLLNTGLLGLLELTLSAFNESDEG